MVFAKRTGKPDRRFERKGACPHGHAYTPENTKWIANKWTKPYQECRTCRRLIRAKRRNERYRTDPDYRMKIKLKERRRKARRKAERNAEPVRGR